MVWFLLNEEKNDINITIMPSIMIIMKCFCSLLRGATGLYEIKPQKHIINKYSYIIMIIERREKLMVAASSMFVGILPAANIRQNPIAIKDPPC